jgi:hypothetical protein
VVVGWVGGVERGGGGAIVTDSFRGILAECDGVVLRYVKADTQALQRE